MYAMVNKAVEDLVVRQHGEATWETIKTRAEVHEEAFISNQDYPDEMSYKLVDAATQVLGIPSDEMLVSFGEHWVLKTARESYGPIMKAGGRTLKEFLLNLPNFQTRVAMIYPGQRPPQFHCSDVQEHSLKLHYVTHRSGLSAFVIGLVRGLGTLYRTPATCNLVARKDTGAKHDVLEVNWSPIV